MAKLYNISNWSEQNWYSTGGTRDKKVYLNPDDNELYYFKKSFKKGQRDFRYEFWSEIIASELGKNLGFDVLDYHIAYSDDDIGCISKSMISQDNEELVEGGKYLQAYDNTFNPDDRKLRHQYTFQLIVGALKSLSLEQYFENLVEIIVFDAIIGNSDRHQENWALIIKHTLTTQAMAEIEGSIERPHLSDLPKWFKKIIKRIVTQDGKLTPEFKQARLKLPKKGKTKFAPIYDSGCSFGRDLSEEAVEKLLSNPSELSNYIDKGLCEIHWDSEKVSHYSIIANLLEIEEVKGLVISIIVRARKNYNADFVQGLINTVDDELIAVKPNEKLPKNRKMLMSKLIDLRIKKLFSLIES